MKISRLGCCLLALAAFGPSAAFGAAEPGPEAQPIEIRNEVLGRRAIDSLVPDGAQVKKGSPLCELDSDSLPDQLVDAELATKRKAADLDNAEKMWQAAEIKKRTVLLQNASLVHRSELDLKL